MRGFRESSRSGAGRWDLKDAREIEKWDRRITVIDQHPMFKGVTREFLDADTQRFMDYSDESGTSCIVHLWV
jgi:hypothetical protein